jgi:hypothetical protein
MPETTSRSAAVRAATLAAAIIAVGAMGTARADTAGARCDVYPKGSDRASAILPGQPAAQRPGGVVARAPVRGPQVASPQAPFDRTLTLQGVKFRVVSANRGSINRLEITPSGLSVDNSPKVREIEGTVSGAEVADLNADGSPEIYVYVTSAGSGSYGSLVAYSANRRKSLSEIYMAPITDDAKASDGYMGHDRFAVVENTLVRRFPIYRAGDTNAAPTGGTRQLHYTLSPGEASWVLRLDRMTDNR